MGGVTTEAYRIEGSFLSELRTTGAIDSQQDLLARFRLNLDAISTGDVFGYYVDEIPPECRVPNPPKWCWAVKAITPETSLFVIDSLIKNGLLEPRTRRGWQTIAQSRSFYELAPSLFRQISLADLKWPAERSLQILDRVFMASSPVAITEGGTPMDEYCREHREDPICWVIDTPIASSTARGLAQGLLLISQLHRDKQLHDEQVRTIYDISHSELSATHSISDLNPRSIEIMTYGLKLGDKQRSAISTAVAAGSVGLCAEAGPCYEMCRKPNPPKICQYIHALPVTAIFVDQLVHSGIWKEKEAMAAWQSLTTTMQARGFGTLAIDTVPLPEKPKPVRRTTTKEVSTVK